MATCSEFSLSLSIEAHKRNIHNEMAKPEAQRNKRQVERSQRKIIKCEKELQMLRNHGRFEALTVQSPLTFKHAYSQRYFTYKAASQRPVGGGRCSSR